MNNIELLSEILSTVSFAEWQKIKKAIDFM